jgi:Fe-S oxidoreductase
VLPVPRSFLSVESSCSGELSGEDGLEAALVGLWVGDGLLELVDPYPIVSNLKLGTGYNPPEPRVHFAYPEDGGSFSHAALRCVGAGLCRDTQSGTMCPSYMATLDEQHTTRGRARILYEMLEGKTITDGFRSKEVHEALDLCLACKGCLGDCPVDVEMATYKAEFLSRHYKRRLRPPAAYSMGLIMLHARLASRVPGLANALASLAPVKRLAGISPERQMPRFARQTFTAWFRERGVVNAGAAPVLLFPDTFSNYLRPETLRAATTVLEAAGFRVTVPEAALCCGRPLYDYGMLETAKRFWRRMLAGLREQIREGVFLVGVEPSCVAAFRDELPGLMPHDEDARRLNFQALTLAELLVTVAVHHDLSVKIAEHRLLPLLREQPEDTLIVADGFSCRTQIEQLTERRTTHTAELVASALDALSGR